MIYSAESQLRSPGSFAAAGRADLRRSPPIAWQFFLRRLQSEHRRSLLGYLWILLPPLATTGVWMVLHATRMLMVGPTELPYPLFVLSGTMLWQLFVDALNAPLQRLTASRAILTKSRIPHEALMLAGILDVLFNFAVRAVILVPVLAWFGSWPALSVLLAPLGVAALLILGFAAGLVLAPVGLLYPDVSRALTLATNVLFFLTPVLYPLPSTGAGAWLGVLNPVTPVLVTARRWLTGGALASAPGFVPVIAVAVLALLTGWCSYRLARPHIVARL